MTPRPAGRPIVSSRYPRDTAVRSRPPGYPVLTDKDARIPTGAKELSRQIGSVLWRPGEMYRSDTHQPGNFHSLLSIILAALALCLFTDATSVSAQESGDLVDLLQDLPEGSRVRLDLRSQPAPAVGRMAGWSDTTLVLASEENRSAYAIGQVRRVWISDGHLGGRGARTGALVGGGIGFGLGVLGRLSGFGGGGSDVDGTALLAGAVVALPGALIGAGAGYLHGRQQTDWRLQFEARDGRVGLRAEVPFP